VVWQDTITHQGIHHCLAPMEKKHKVLLVGTKFEIMKEYEETDVGLSESGSIAILLMRLHQLWHTNRLRVLL
jgi:hypothetical protein